MPSATPKLIIFGEPKKTRSAIPKAERRNPKMICRMARTLAVSAMFICRNVADVIVIYIR